MNRTILLILVLTFAMLAGTARAQSAETSGSSKLQKNNSQSGAWIVHVIPDPASGIPEIVNIALFTNDGKIVNVDADGSASVGLWKSVGHRKSRVTFMGSIIQDGEPVLLKVRALPQLNQGATEFDGPFETEIFDLAGNRIFQFQGTVHATRFHIEPLD